MNRQLIFVYNADGKLFNSIADFAHKIIFPDTYKCQLCTLTHDKVFIKKEWKSFIKDLPVKSLFFHKDEFKKKFKIETSFPVIFFKENETLQTFLTKEEIEECQFSEQLMKAISSKLSKYDQHYYSNL